MSEILQNKETIKLYGDSQDKLDLDELYHHGVKGQRWGVRKNRLKSAFSRKKRPKKQKVQKKGKYQDKQQALDAKDLRYINKHKSEYTTKEINDVLNRINTEQRLSQMAKDQKRSRRIFKMITGNPVFKMAAVASLSALSYATVNYIVNKDSRSKKNYAKDLAIGAFTGGVGASPMPDPIKNDAKRLAKSFGSNNDPNKKKKG